MRMLDHHTVKKAFAFQLTTLRLALAHRVVCNTNISSTLRCMYRTSVAEVKCVIFCHVLQVLG